ncbi:MAG: hypothetical protein N3A54_06995 [Patescibacteria group bacterium]|nr:hypothetical protein [Patescibacteria group bacterium]
MKKDVFDFMYVNGMEKSESFYALVYQGGGKLGKHGTYLPATHRGKDGYAEDGGVFYGGKKVDDFVYGAHLVRSNGKDKACLEVPQNAYSLQILLLTKSYNLPIVCLKRLQREINKRVQDKNRKQIIRGYEIYSVAVEDQELCKEFKEYFQKFQIYFYNSREEAIEECPEPKRKGIYIVLRKVENEKPIIVVP